MTHRVAVAILTLLAVGGTSEAADWTSIRPGVTTEADLISAFGPPDEVVATFPWGEWSARWKKRPLTRNYRLRYRMQSSKSPLLVGPGGKADDVDVEVWDRRVDAVRWHYGGPSARVAGTTLRADPEMTFRITESITRGGKALAHGLISAELGPGDTSAEVLLQLK